jgi:hypothetical protein
LNLEQNLELYFGGELTDRKLWEQGVEAVSREFAALAQEPLGLLRKECAAIRAAKESLHRLFALADGDERCRACAGACCARGKYHFTVVDLLVHLDAGVELFEPRFDSGVCPYLGEAGCLMSPPFRPYTCTTFVCDTVEEGLAAPQKELFYRVATELRSSYGRVERLFGGRFMYGLLINSERRLRGGGAILGAGLRG